MQTAILVTFSEEIPEKDLKELLEAIARVGDYLNLTCVEHSAMVFNPDHGGVTIYQP